MSDPVLGLVRLSAAATCRARRWQVGDRLRGWDGRGGCTTILLTAIGENTILARRWMKVSGSWGAENKWRLDLRAWERVDD